MIYDQPDTIPMVSKVTGYRLVIRPIGAEQGVPLITLSEHRTKAEANRAQATYVSQWRRGLTPLQRTNYHWPLRFSAPIETHRPRTYLLRYGSSRYSFGWLSIAPVTTTVEEQP